ncbi:hypothetical protein [Endozoicomonas sp. 8E]|uniref:hypothetical protein n=1 Tax=Endozoicomonas sp. 8E TaxID=3035692 RepID=UPI0029394EA7|nr:hypothetical protein [Endozoicomonas sp. 8E]WOG29592.1 hypothetical protein P6910_08050 [Endozoicomonas sp. 8E]
MSKFCPNALSLAVAVAISSSIISIQALAERRLQTKSVDITNEHVEFTQSEIIVRPTLADDQQPIPGSFTTTYCYYTDVSAAYAMPAKSFIGVASHFCGGVSSVDLFETGENDVAQKYIKVLKLGDEEIFRFTHNLEEKELVIEVRSGMTDPDSVAAVRSQLTGMESLEPLTKIARPTQLFDLLEGAGKRAGNLGKSDHYVTLAGIEVDKVEVGGRTFMRLVSAGDRPPEPERLGQSLFVNDDALLAAATSAYIQVHVLGEALQQQALNELLAHSKPVGYVVHVKDGSKVYPVPAGYPKLEVAEAPGEVIVFHSQRLNPDDVAFVEKLYDLWQEAEGPQPSPAVLTKVKTHKVRAYQYVIRSRQMTVLEEFVARQGVNQDQPTTLSNKDKRAMGALAFYESLDQALVSATPDKIHSIREFEVTLEDLRVASSFITPIWMHNQLEKHFGFKPALRDLLTNQHFVQNIVDHIPVIAKLKTDDLYDDEQFVSKVLGERARQMAEVFSKLDELYSEEAELVVFKHKLEIESGRADASDEKKLELQQIYQKVKAKHAWTLAKLQDQKTLVKTLMQEVRQCPLLEQQVYDASSKVIKAQHSKIATQLGIDDWDDSQPTGEQAGRLLKKVDGICGAALIKNQLLPVNEADLKARHQTIQQHLQQPGTGTSAENEAEIKARYATLKQELEDIRTPGHPKAMPLVLEKLAAVEKALAMDDLNSKADVYYRRDAISKAIQTSITKARQAAEKEALETLEGLEEIVNIKANEGDDNTERVVRLRARLTEAEKEALEILEELEEALNRKTNEGDDNTERVDRLRAGLTDDDINEKALEGTDYYPWKVAMFEIRGVKRGGIDGILAFYVEEVDERAIENQKEILRAVENKLNIDIRENTAAKERGKHFVAKLADDLKLELKKDTSLDDQKNALREKILELRKKVEGFYDDNGFRKDMNNEIARPLNIEGYEEDADLIYQQSLIGLKLRELNDEVDSAGQPTVNERIAAIEDELDKHMAHLGPKPRFVLDREVAKASRTIEEAESELEIAQQKLEAMLQPDGDESTGSKTREQARLKAEIEVRKADIERMKDALRAAGKAVENDDGPFQYTPEQAEVLDAIHTFTQQHSLKKQALEAAMSLAELALESGEVIPDLTTFDFDEELAPVHLRALAGDALTFDQANRIVKIFKSLKKTFPVPLFEPLENQPSNVLKIIRQLVSRARDELQSGAKQYDDEIHGMAKTAIHYVDYEPGDLNSFPEYLAASYASANKIITLLREGLISKVELENYMKAVRGVDGYQTADEFEHFLGYKHRVNLPHFNSIVQMLSDRGAEEFMQMAFNPVALSANGPAGMKESVVGMKEYAAAVITNYVLDDIAFDNGRRTAVFLANIQETLTPYAHAAGLSESDLIQAIHDTLMQAHAAAVERQLSDYWVKPSAFLVQAVTWYYSSYKPLLATQTLSQASALSLSNMSFLYLLDLTNRGDYLHRMLTPFQHWLECLGVDLDRTGQYAYHSGIEQISEVGGLAMPMGKAASSVILLKTGSMLFARQHNANPHRYRSISRLVPEIVKSMGSGQGVQIPLLHRITPQKVKTLASATVGLVLGPAATVGAYAHGLISGFTYAQTLGFALASSLTFDFFINDNKMLTQWLGGPLGRSLDKINRWTGVGETQDTYLQRTAIASPQRFSETDEAYANRAKANNTMSGWTRQENYLQFRERRDRTMKLFENGWEQYFMENVPRWSFSHAESIPYFYTLGAFYKCQMGDDQKVHVHDKRNAPQSSFPTATSADHHDTGEYFSLPEQP